MFIVERMYRGVILPDEVNRRVVTALVPAMRTLLGFSGYTTVDFDRGRFGTYTRYADRTAAEVVCSATPGAVRSLLVDMVPAPPQASIGVELQGMRRKGPARYLSLRDYAGCPDPGELARRVGERLLPFVEAMPGLCGFHLLDMGAGRVASLNLLDTLNRAETADALVQPLIAQHLPDLLPHPPTIMTGRVLSDISW